MVMPESLWTEQIPLALNPGETRTITLATETPLPEGKSISISLGNEDQAITSSLSQLRSRGSQAAVEFNSQDASPDNSTR